jgi:biotin carboxylase
VTPASGLYHGLRGKRLALVESMLYDAFYNGLHRARELGLEIWLLVGDPDWYTDGRDWASHPLAQADRVIDVDTSDVDAVVAAITDGGIPLVDGVTTFSDYHTVVAATAARRLGLPAPDPAAISTANHKNRLRDLLGNEPYNVRHALVTDPRQLPSAADELGFPMVAKPPAEAISYGVRRVDSADELRGAYAELSTVTRSLRGQPRPGHVLLEQYVPGVEVSVESMTVEGTTHFYGVTSKELYLPPAFLERSHCFPVPLPPAEWDRLRETVATVLRRMGYRHGPCHTEVKLTPDGPRIIEVNPRLPADCITMMVDDVCGHNPVLDAKLLAVGGRPDLYRLERRGGAAVVMLYPPAAGLLESIDGIREASAIPGVSILLHAESGDHLWSRVDNSASVGFAYATGKDPELALAAAEQAAALLTINVNEVE